MKIGILGTGQIGSTLVTRLSAAGHEVKVANSRGPDTIAPELLTHGATAATAQDAVAGVDVVILSIPMERLSAVLELVRALPPEVLVIDTSNYMPYRTDRKEAIENGQVESDWVAEQLQRPIAKAWNAIWAGSFATKAKPSGAPDRIAIPVAADDAEHRAIAMNLVDDTGFDALDAGTIAESWRQQPGAPAYCTDLTRDELVSALARAERHRLPIRRDLSTAAIRERSDDGATELDPEHTIALTRLINM